MDVFLIVVAILCILNACYSVYTIFKKKYEEQHIAVDIVILASKDGGIQNLHVLLIKRKKDPFANYWAIPGGHVDEGETLDQTAYRELQEETSLSAQELNGVSLHQFKTYGDPKRDPRYRMISVVYYAIVPYSEKLLTAVKAQDDAKKTKWVSLRNINSKSPMSYGNTAYTPLKLAFDHEKILSDIFINAIAGALK
jgi:8-oxo-dGTP diphosphatase